LIAEPIAPFMRPWCNEYAAMDKDGAAGSLFGAAPKLLGRLAYVSEACLLAFEEGILVQESMSPLANGQAMADMLFRRRMPRFSGPGSAAARYRRGRRSPGASGDGWGIHQAHLKRLLILQERTGG
jgi:hypothetical protein